MTRRSRGGPPWKPRARTLAPKRRRWRRPPENRWETRSPSRKTSSPVTVHMQRFAPRRPSRLGPPLRRSRVSWSITPASPRASGFSSAGGRNRAGEFRQEADGPPRPDRLRLEELVEVGQQEQELRVVLLLTKLNFVYFARQLADRGSVATVLAEGVVGPDQLVAH